MQWTSLFLFFSLGISRPPTNYFAIWNVGRGHWSTYIAEEYCIHINIGGTRPPNSYRINQCAYLPNYIYFNNFKKTNTNQLKKFHNQVRSIELINSNSKIKPFRESSNIPKRVVIKLDELKKINELFSKKNTPLNTSTWGNIVLEL